MILIWDSIVSLVKGGHERYMEGQPERDLKKEIRDQERRQKRENRQAERIRRLEETLEAEKQAAQALEQENSEAAAALNARQEQKEASSHGFLEGTKLTPPKKQKKHQRLLFRPLRRILKSGLQQPVRDSWNSVYIGQILPVRLLMTILILIQRWNTRLQILWILTKSRLMRTRVKKFQILLRISGKRNSKIQKHLFSPQHRKPLSL